MKVLVTRARDAGETTAQRLRERVHEPVLLPLIDYRDTGSALPERQFDAVAFTSAAAIAVLTERPSAEWTPLLALPAFCVGEATASAAHKAGFKTVVTGPGNATGLTRTILDKFAGLRKPARLLYLAPRDRAFDLSAALSGRGVEIAEIELYAAETVDPGEETLRSTLKACTGGAALLYSPRTAAHLVALATKYAAGDLLTGLTLIAISENVARAIAGHGLPDVLVSEKPHEDGLFELLDRLDRGGRTIPRNGEENDQGHH